MSAPDKLSLRVIEVENGYIVMNDEGNLRDTKKWVAGDIPELRELIGDLASGVIQIEDEK